MRTPVTTLDTWPFWAPSDLESVEAALDLAGVREGDHVVDLGCGDGQVLVAAARRGCRVTGVEFDGELVERARRSLREHDVEGEVIEGDVFAFDLSTCDVVFSYLAPATLQRLLPRLQKVRDLRVVTVDFAIPGVEAVAEEGPNHLYVMPAPVDEQVDLGWPSPGVLVGVVPDRHSLTCLGPIVPKGRVDVRLTGDLPDALTIAVGADRLAATGPLAIDIRWNELDEGTFVTGTIDVDGIGGLAVFALVTETEDGLWEVTRRGVRNLSYRIAVDRAWRPSSFADLLAACD